MRRIRSVRWWELLPEAVLAVGLGVFTLTEWDASTSAFGSTKARWLMAGTAAAWLAARVLLVRFTPWPVLRLVTFGAGAAAVLAVVVLPAYDDETVIETLPVARGATSTTAPRSTTAGPSTTAAPDATADPRAPSATVRPTPVPGPPTTVSAPPTTTAPAAIRSASLHGIDHRASGTARVYRRHDGSFVVGLEDIDIQPGPDYDVYVVPGANREDVDGGTRLGDLRGNKGTQYDEVPAGIDLARGEWTVLVWCQTFAVPVAGATPS